MSLLSPSESHAFHRLFSVGDGDDDDSDPRNDNDSGRHNGLGDLAPEWSMYARELAVELPPPHAPGDRDALIKATKDLMALDQGRDQDRNRDRDRRWSGAQHERWRNVTPSSWPATREDREKPSPRSLHQSPNLPPLPPFPSLHHHTSDPFNFNFSRPQNNAVTPDRTLSAPIVRHPPKPSSSSAPSLLDDGFSVRSKLPPSQEEAPPAKRRKSSPTNSADSGSTSSHTPTSTTSRDRKPALLSPSQKKLNHIQSEQKRRANIRRGYEALCDTVPALREAIRKEEAEPGKKSGEGEFAVSGEVNGRAKAKRKKKADEDGERLDGRAGPRSENVVLQKSIDYINDLLAERQALLARYHNARQRLHPTHPALNSSPYSRPGAQPPWEREWLGGTGDADLDEDD